MQIVSCGIDGFAMSHPAYQELTDVQAANTDPSHPLLSRTWIKRWPDYSAIRKLWGWGTKQAAVSQLLFLSAGKSRNAVCSTRREPSAELQKPESWERERVISGRGLGGAVCLETLLMPPTPENINISSPFSTAPSLSLLLAPNTKAQMKFLKVDYFCLVIFSICC